MQMEGMGSREKEALKGRMGKEKGRPGKRGWAQEREAEKVGRGREGGGRERGDREGGSRRRGRLKWGKHTGEAERETQEGRRRARMGRKGSEGQGKEKEAA